MTDQTVTLSLSSDEALVLLEWLSRFNRSEDRRFDHPAEQRVLWDMESMLESRLVAPFDPNYRDLLAIAREKVSTS